MPITRIEQHITKYILYNQHNTPYELSKPQPNHFIDADSVLVEFSITSI